MSQHYFFVRNSPSVFSLSGAPAFYFDKETDTTAIRSRFDNDQVVFIADSQVSAENIEVFAAAMEKAWRDMREFYAARAKGEAVEGDEDDVSPDSPVSGD